MVDIANLKSPDATVVASELWKLLKEKTSLKKPLAQKIIDSQSILDAAERHAKFEEILGSIDDAETLTAAMEFYARMGHLYNLANLVARENYVRDINKGEASHSPVDSIGKYSGGKSVAALIEAYSTPELDISLTAHPTNVNTVGFMSALKDVGKALDDDDITALGNAIAAVASTEMTPEKNFSAAEETGHMLYYLENIWDGIDKTYEDFDNALAGQASAGDEYDPRQFFLNIKLHSWGSSGDKDGNKKINAATTAASMSAHISKGHELIEKALKQIPGAPAIPSAEELHDPSIREDYLLQLKTFLSQQSPTNKQALLLRRQLETFGLTMGTIEYRETAEEHESIFKFLLKDSITYPDASTDRIATLESLLNEQKSQFIDLVRARYAEVSQKFDQATGEPRAGVKLDDGEKAFYTTISRLILARDNPDMVKNYVMAECKGAANMLELVALCEAVSTDAGRKPRLGIVPLFESPEELTQIDGIMSEALNNDAFKTYRNQVHAYRQSTGDILPNSPITQQVQIAHSDTGRRSGTAAARSFILEAHNRLKSIEDDLGVRFQFFEGGGISDPFRGGIRSIPSLINEYGIHEFAKFTFQGGDGLNYFNYKPSVTRLFERVMTHMAEVSGLGKENPVETNPETEARVNGFLQKFLGNYRTQYFGQPDAEENDELNGYNRVAARALQQVFDYSEGRIGGTIGTRAGGRKAGETEDSVDFVGGVRTIGYSEAYQHGGFDPVLIGAREIGINGGQEEYGHPQALQEEYKHSPIMREVLDRYASAVTRSFPNEVIQRALDRHLVTIDQLTNADPNDPRGLNCANDPGQQMANYLKWLEGCYQEAAKMAIAAQTGKSPNLDGLSPAQANIELRNQVLACYPNLWDIAEHHERYGELTRMAKVQFHRLTGIPDNVMLSLDSANFVATVIGDERMDREFGINISRGEDGKLTPETIESMHEGGKLRNDLVNAAKQTKAGKLLDRFLRADHGALDSMTYARQIGVDDNIFKERFDDVTKGRSDNDKDPAVFRIIKEAAIKGIHFLLGSTEALKGSAHRPGLDHGKAA